MSKACLGQVPNCDRDAIHVALKKVTVGVDGLQPGDHVALIRQDTIGIADNPIGIIDPFLKSVKKGDSVWLCLYPNSVVDMIHHWSHPSFDQDKHTSEMWIRQYAAGMCINYDDLMWHADHYLKYRSYWCEGGRFEGEYLNPAFWDHYEKVTGVAVDDDDRNSFFTCSC